MTDDTSTRQPDTFRFACPNCGVVLKSGTVRAGSQFRCPKCNTSGIVPNPDDDTVAAGYGLSSVPEQRPAPAFSPSPAGSRQDDEPPPLDDRRSDGAPHTASERPAYSTYRRPVLPAHPMFDGVFDFLRAKGVFAVWILMTLGLALVLTLLLIADGMASIRETGLTTGAVGSIGGMIFLGLAFMIGLIWIVPALVQSLNVMTETASGNRMIENFPDVVWIDWVQDSLYVILPGLATGIAAYAASRPFPAAWPLIAAAVSVLTFPVFVLSAFDQQTCYGVFSLRVARSCGVAPKAWMIFLLETTGLLLAAFIVTRVGWVVISALPGILFLLSLPIAILFLAAEIVTGMMIYFRLLGRLAWVIEEKEREAEWEEEEEGEEEA